MLRPLHSIRIQLTAWYSFLVLTTLVVFGVIAYLSTERQLKKNLDKSLKSEVLWFKTNYDPRTGKPKSMRAQSLHKTQGDSGSVQQPVDKDRLEVPDSLSLILSQLYAHLVQHQAYIEVTSNITGAIPFHSMPVDTSIVIDKYPRDTVGLQTLRNGQGVELRVASIETDQLQVIVAYPLEDLSDVLDSLFSIFIWLIPIALAVSVGGGWLLAYISLRRVDEVTKTAREISAQNLDRQIPNHVVDDEIGRLISTFNDMLSRLRQSFDQIKQFSSDASHELRTPLTIDRKSVV